MGWNPFKSIKKIVKSVGKRIKKIGRGLKKIMAKIAKPFAKLGPLGSIALSMFIPWAAGAIWTGMTGTTLTLANFGAQAATNIASDSLFKKAIGYVMKGVHWGATKVKTAYQFVTDKISTGIDTLTGKAKDVLGANADAGDLLADAVQNGPELDVAQSVDFSKNIATEAAAQPLGVELDTAKILTDSTSSEVSGKVAEKAVEKSFFEKATDKAKESVIGAVGTNLDAALAPQEETAEGGISYAQPYNFLGDNTSYTKYNEQQTMLQNQGFSFGGPAYDANITTSGFGQDEYYSWFNTYKAQV
tara:strand:- start:5971 stop:6876 length:906 start_codon:yes stop_codon:yes gene_type:complete